MTTIDANLPSRPDAIAIIYIAASQDRVWKALTDAAAQRWAALLSGPKTLVETGKPLPSPF